MGYLNKPAMAAAALFGGAVVAAAQSVDWNSWQLIDDERVTSQFAAAMTLQESISSQTVTIPPEGVDLNKVLNKKPQVGHQVILTKKVNAAKDTTVKLGMAVDWWFEVYCNNRIVYSTYRSGGNVDYPYTAKDHIFALELHKGENLVTIYLKSGANSFTAAIQEMPADTPAGCVSRMNENAVHLPGTFKLRQGPWLLEPAPGAITAAFLTDGNMGAGVEYRLAGTQEWTQCWHTIGGILHDATDLHRIRLTGLVPGKVYEYRVLIALDEKNYKALDTYKFTAPLAECGEFEFFATSDTQFGDAKRGRLLAGWKELLEKASLQISIGDLTSIYDDFDAMLFGGYFNWQSPEVYHGKPFIAVRGNHELRGKERARWFELAGPASGKGYYSFTYGKVCFVALDCWGEEEDYQSRPLVGNAVKSYLEEQCKWVEKLVKSPEYCNAQYRIIMAHSAPYAVDLNREICKVANYIAEPLFKASLSGEAQIHLYLAGHVHVYRRTVPGTNRVYATTPVTENQVLTWENFNFPILIFDGPGHNNGLEVSASTVKVTPEGLEVKSFDELNCCFDHFFIDKNGKLCEIDEPYKKSILKLYEF